jgi:hypothetical protein
MVWGRGRERVRMRENVYLGVLDGVCRGQRLRRIWMDLPSERGQDDENLREQ